LPGSIQIIADLDIQLAVFFLKTLDDALDQNNQRLNDLLKEENNRINELMQNIKNADIDCTDDFATDLEEFYGVQSTINLYH